MNNFKQITSITHLEELSADESFECFIQLQFNVRSVKWIQYDGYKFFITNCIDDTEQELTAEQLMDKSETNIGEAITLGALWYDADLKPSNNKIEWKNESKAERQQRWDDEEEQRQFDVEAGNCSEASVEYNRRTGTIRLVEETEEQADYGMRHKAVNRVEKMMDELADCKGYLKVLIGYLYEAEKKHYEETEVSERATHIFETTILPAIKLVGWK